MTMVECPIDGHSCSVPSCKNRNRDCQSIVRIDAVMQFPDNLLEDTAEQLGINPDAYVAAVTARRIALSNGLD